MSISDRLSALGRGAAQGSTAGFADEGFAKILDYLPRPDDGTGIPREYDGGAEAQYLKSARADDADAQAKYPLNFGAGALAGAAPAAVATGGAGVAGQVGLGALQGYGNSERGGIDRIKDAVKGGAVGGALGATGNAVAAAAPAAKAAFGKLFQGPPPPSLQPAMAGATPVALAAEPELGGAQINRMVPPELPPRPNTADLSDITPPSGNLAEEERFAQRAIDGRASFPPVDPTKPLPKNPAWKHFNGVPDEEVDQLEQRLRQTEANGQKKIEARIEDRNNPQGATVRPPKRAKKAAAAPAEPTALARSTPDAPAARPSMTAIDKPLIGPKQMSDDKILDLARAGKPANENMPQGPKGLSPEQLAQSKQELSKQFQSMTKPGNVVQLDDGAIQSANDPFTAGRVREFQQHAKAADAAGESDQAQWFRDQIEEMLSGAAE